MFKVGDKVKRIQNYDYDVWKASLGYMHNPLGVYTIEDIKQDCDSESALPAPGLKLVELSCFWRASNFELVESAKETNMISLKENKTALVNLKLTIDAIENLDRLIEHYSEDKLGPAYVEMKHVRHGSVDVQIDRKFMVVALVAQRQKLVDYMATLGIDATN